MQLFSKIMLVSAVFVTSYSCKKETITPVEPIAPPVETPVNNLVKIGETYIMGAKAKAVIYSAKSFVTGYNEVYVALFDSADGSKLSRGHFDVIPMMDMGVMQHSSPVENTEDTLTADGYFKCAVVFSMPGTSSQWFLNLNFHNHKNELEGKGSLGVNVAESSPARFKSTVMALDSNAKVFISYLLPTSPKVGINDFEIVLHKKLSMMDYFPIENYSVEIVPEMPSMGHGSPNNINPVHYSKGHYKGKVNFTMTGLWRINLKIYKNGTLLSNDQYFEVTL